jgi:rod shape-determining protein MreD
MNDARARPIVIPVTMVIALILETVPLPDWASVARPEFAAMTLIYWNMALPRRVGVGMGWLYGLFVDVLTGSLLGQHALGFTVVAYLSIRLHQRVRVFPLWQQAVSIALILFPYLLLTLWVDGMTGRDPDSMSYWVPLISSAILWPALFLALRGLRRSARLS